MGRDNPYTQAGIIYSYKVFKNSAR